MAIFKGAGVAIVTPFHEDGSINYEKFEELVNEQIAGGTDAIIVCGTTGEASTLTHEEHLDLIRFCAEKVSNIVAIKEASGNISQVVKLMSLAGGRLDLYSGNDDQVVPLLSLGGKGVISVLSNVAPKQMHDICQKFFDGDIEGSMKEQLRAIELYDAIFSEVNPIPVKTALNLMGKNAGPAHMPLSEMEPENVEKLKKAMINYGIL